MTDRLVTDLPEPDSPTSATRLAGSDGQVDTIDRRNLAAAGAEDRPQPADVEDGFGALVHHPVSVQQAGRAQDRVDPAPFSAAFERLRGAAA